MDLGVPCSNQGVGTILMAYSSGVERSPDKTDVAGSNPATPTILRAGGIVSRWSHKPVEVGAIPTHRIQVWECGEVRESRRTVNPFLIGE